MNLSLSDITNVATPVATRAPRGSVGAKRHSLSIHLKPLPSQFLWSGASTPKTPSPREEATEEGRRSARSKDHLKCRFDKIQHLQPEEEELKFQFEQMLIERELSESEKERLRGINGEEKWSMLIDQSKLETKDYINLLKRKPVTAMQQLVFPIYKPDNTEWVLEFIASGGLAIIVKLIGEYLEKILTKKDKIQYYSLINNSVVVLRGIAQCEEGFQSVLRHIECIEELFLNISTLTSDRSRALFLSLVSLLGSRDEQTHVRLLVVLQQSVLRFMSLLCSSNQTVAATAFTCVNSLIMSNLHQDIILKEALKTEFKEKGIITVYQQLKDREDLLPSLSSQLRIFSKHLSKEKEIKDSNNENKVPFSDDSEIQKQYTKMVNLLSEIKYPSKLNSQKWNLIVNYTEQVLSKEKVKSNDVYSDIFISQPNPEVSITLEIDPQACKRPYKHSVSFGKIQNSVIPRDPVPFKQTLRPSTTSSSKVQLENSVWAKMKPQITLSKVVVDLDLECEPYENEIFLDLKRWNAINSMLSKFPLSNPESIKSVITHMDDEILSLSDLEKIQNFLPTQSEREKLKSVMVDVNKMGDPEVFLFTLMEIPDIESRLESWQFKLKYPKTYVECKSQHESVLNAATQILESKNLTDLLEIILGICNLLHISIKQSYMSLSALSRLADQRIRKDSEMTILHLIVDYISKTKPQLLHFYKDLSSLQKVKEIKNMNAMTTQIQGLENGIKKIENFLLTPESEYGLFFVKFEQFLADAKPTLNSLQKLHKTTRDQFDRVLQYFAETEPTNVFEELNSFLFKFKKTVASFEEQQLHLK